MAESDVASKILAEIPRNPSMRDINDICVKYGIPSLAQGLIDIPPPAALIDKLAAAASESVHSYLNRRGDPEFINGVQLMLKTHYNVDVSTDQLVATQGVTGGIVSTLLSCRPSGRPARVGLVEPFYTYHLFQTRTLLGPDAVVEAVPILHNDGSVDKAQVAALASQNLDALVLTNPSNPLAVVCAREDVEAIVEATRKAGTRLIVDECYADMVWGAPFWSPAMLGEAMPPHVVVCRGFSKGLGAQSWRVGYLIAAAGTAADVARCVDPIYICSPLTQIAIGRFLLDGDAYITHRDFVVRTMRANYVILRAAFAAAFPTWEALEPAGTMYAVFKHTEPSDMAAVRKALVAGVGVCPGSMFVLPDSAGPDGFTGFVRIHCGVTEERAREIAAAITPKAATV